MSRADFSNAPRDWAVVAADGKDMMFAGLKLLN
jgi:hypothetical protein